MCIMGVNNSIRKFFIELSILFALFRVFSGAGESPEKLCSFLSF